MYKIYFEHRSLCICSEKEDTLSDPNAICFYLGENFAFSDLITAFEQNPCFQRIYVPSAYPKATYEKICKEFYEVNAAGGLVSNRRGDFLLIRRGGLWDLPKGHQDPGEEISVTALREVEEETGICGLILKDLICITDHIYLRAGKWHLKHTYWYDMLDSSPIDLTPQKEEDITVAAWVARSGLSAYLTNTYPSIQEVFLKEKNLKRHKK